jgi:hypothetical protein
MKIKGGKAFRRAAQVAPKSAEGAKISERVRKLESERVKDAHQCAVIALVDLLTFLHSHLLTVCLHSKRSGPPTTDERAWIRASVNRRPSAVCRLTSIV